MQAFAEKMVDLFYSYLPQPTPSEDRLKQTKIIAHRGAHDQQKGYLENTMPAFEHAQRLGCWGIEFDVHATADKKLVVHHDDTLERLWGHRHAIRNSDFKTIREIAPDIPLLSEVVSAFGHSMHLFIELKAPFSAEDELKAELNVLTPCKDYHLISLDETIFSQLSQFPNPSLLLVGELNSTQRFCNLSLEKDYGGVLGHYVLLRNRLLKRLQNAHKKAGVGFVDSRYNLYREVNRGLDWLFTNDAEQVLKVLRTK